jgi:dihydroorotate dehydrogenase electron transfer subunit
MIQQNASLVERVGDGAYQELVLQAPELAQQLQPGQAVLVRAGWGLDPYLRRTFYPIAFDVETFTLRLPPSGDRGHAWLRLCPPGAAIDCLGPIGVGFRLPAGASRLLCLGEGDLAWALLPLVHLADAAHLSVTLATTAAAARAVIPAQRLPLSVEYRAATLAAGRADRSRPGLLTPELLGWADAIAAAGSSSFYFHLAEAIREHRLVLPRGFGQALVAADFLCGVGACMACAADVAGGRRRVCLRGPVFDLTAVI